MSFIPSPTLTLGTSQIEILTHALGSPDSEAYIQQLICRLEEPVNAGAFESAWAYLCTKHAALRSSFCWSDEGLPQQRVHEAVPLPLEQLDWRGLEPTEFEAHLERWLATDRARGFDVTQAPLVRLNLILREADSFVFVWTSHHGILDGRSRLILLEELFSTYAELCNGIELIFPKTPSVSELTLETPSTLEAAERYWSEVIEGFEAATPLEFGFPTLESVSHRVESFRLDPELTGKLQNLCSEIDVTPNTLLQGAWGLLLNRYTGQDDLVFGVSASGRMPKVPGDSDVIGMRVNTFPLRVKPASDRPVADWLKGIRKQWNSARQHGAIPLRTIRSYSAVPAGAPLFETLAVFENYVLNSKLREQGGAWNSRTFSVRGITNFPLVVFGYADSNGELLFELVYETARFDRETIRRISVHLQGILQSFAEDPQQPLGAISLLTPAEKQAILDWNATAVPYPRDSSIHQVFEEQAARTPCAVALRFGAQEVSYRDLDSHANQLAHFLRKRGVGSEPRTGVGILMERSIEMIVAILGILKASGAYVPMDPAWPEERLCGLSQTAGLREVLTLERHRKLWTAPNCEAICTDTEAARFEAEPTSPPDSGAHAEQAAYTMFTSGSTGKPKGVTVNHRGVVRLVKGNPYCTISSSDVFLQFAPLSFDASTFEIWGALLNGAALRIAPPFTPSFDELGLWISEGGVTILWLTAALFEAMVDGPVESLAGVKQLLAGGDVLPARHAQKLLSHFPGCHLINGYGPTENTTFTCCHRMESADEVEECLPIGRPIANTQVYILDQQRNPVPVGVRGELYTGGDGLALGYLNEPALTAEKFVPNPFSAAANARLYRTGDIARWRPDGIIEFHGRLDQQVKIRGYRIELGEIEAHFMQHPAIAQAAVIVRQAESGEKSLAAFLVSDHCEIPDVPALRRFLRANLPDAMIPKEIAFLPSLPISANGKVDRAKLSATGRLAPGRLPQRTAATTPLQQRLSSIFAEVLGVKSVALEGNFFDLGGSSLLAMRAVWKIGNALGLRLPVAAFVADPTVQGLSRWISESNPNLNLSAEGESSPASRTQSSVPAGSRIPISFNQRLTLKRLKYPQGDGYLKAIILRGLRMRGPLNIEALEESFQEVIHRHESLRTSLSSTDPETAEQIIHPPRTVRFPRLDIAEDSEDRALERLRDYCTGILRTPFTLTEETPVRLTLVRFGPTDYTLVFAIHHAFFDGSSLQVIFDEVAQCYTARVHGEPCPLPPVSSQYRDYVGWEQLQNQGEAGAELRHFWNENLGGQWFYHSFPADFPRPEVCDHLCPSVTVKLPPTLGNAVQSLATRYRVSPFTVFATSYALYISRLLELNTVVVMTPVSQRTNPAFNALVGWAVRSAPVLVRIDTGKRFSTLLKEAWAFFMSGIEHCAFPNDELYALQQGAPSPEVNPFYMVEVPELATELSLPNLQTEWLSRDTAVNVVGDTRLALVWSGGQATAHFYYRPELFRRETIEGMVNAWLAVLEEVTQFPERLLSDLSPGSRPAWDARKAPQTARQAQLENTVSTVFRDILNLQSVAPEDDFFALGGDSLSAMRTVWKLGKETGVRLPVAEFLARPTPAELAARMADFNPAPVHEAPLKPFPKTNRFPLSFAQRTFLKMLRGPQGKFFNYATQRVLRMRGPLDIVALEQSFNDLVKRHETLRTTLSGLDPDEAEQIVHDETPVCFLHLDIESENEAQAMEQLQEYCTAQLAIPFPLVDHPNVRVTLARLGPNDHALVFIVHHFFFDGDSLLLAFDELARLYSARVTGADVVVSPAPVQHRDFVQWERQQNHGITGARIRQHWEAKAARWYARSFTPDFPRPENTSAIIVPNISACLTPQMSEAIHTLAAANHVSPFAVCISCYALYLHLSRNEPDVTIMTPVSFRYNPAFSAMLGWAAFPIPLFTEFDARKPFRDFVRENWMGLLSGAENSSLAADSTFQLQKGNTTGNFGSFYMVDVPDLALIGTFHGLQTTWVSRDTSLNLVADLRFVISWSAGRATLRLDYRPDLFRRETIEQILKGWLEIVEQAVQFPEWLLSDFSLGKVPTGNHRNLPLPPRRAQLEKTLVAIFRDVLNLQSVGPEDDFFDLGGDSLSAMRALWKLGKETGVRLPVTEFLARPTPAELALRIVEDHPAPQQEEALEPFPKANRFPASSSQRRFLNMLKGPGDRVLRFATLRVLRMQGPLDSAALEQSFNDLVKRHETLRMTLSSLNPEEAEQIVHDDVPVRLSRLEIESVNEVQAIERLQEYCTGQLAIPFTLVDLPNMRVTLARLGANDHALVFIVHHFFFDGESLLLAFNELAQLYSEKATGNATVITPAAVQPRDFVHWERQQNRGDAGARSLQHWSSKTERWYAQVFPPDFPRPKDRYDIILPNISVCLTAQVSDAIQALAAANHVSLFAVCISCYALYVHLSQSAPEVAIMTPASIRYNPVFNGMLGWAASDTPVFTRFNAHQSFRDFMKENWRGIMAGAEHSSFASDALFAMQKGNTTGNSGSLSMVEVPDLGTMGTFHGLKTSWLPRDTSLSTVLDLRFVISWNAGRATIRMDYRRDLYRRESVERILTGWLDILEQASQHPNWLLADFPLPATLTPAS